MQKQNNRGSWRVQIWSGSKLVQPGPSEFSSKFAITLQLLSMQSSLCMHSNRTVLPMAQLGSVRLRVCNFIFSVAARTWVSSEFQHVQAPRAPPAPRIPDGQSTYFASPSVQLLMLAPCLPPGALSHAQTAADGCTVQLLSGTSQNGTATYQPLAVTKDTTRHAHEREPDECRPDGGGTPDDMLQWAMSWLSCRSALAAEPFGSARVQSAAARLGALQHRRKQQQP